MSKTQHLCWCVLKQRGPYLYVLSLSHLELIRSQLFTLSLFLLVSFSHSNVQRERGCGEDQETHFAGFSSQLTASQPASQTEIYQSHSVIHILFRTATVLSKDKGVKTIRNENNHHFYTETLCLWRLKIISFTLYILVMRK